ncbi:acyltransferase family protein [Aquitalea magnusonii]|nr:acyltransferase [Aquitalea magnusonii]
MRHSDDSVIFSPARPDIKSLTGLRFFAAFFILLNHLLLGFVSRDTMFFGRFLANCAFLGMDIFFVLSGFIIHYNYSVKINGSLKKFYAFFVARFSRLYPLFLATFIIDLVLVTRGGGVPWPDVLRVIPFFISMSQSWFYQLASTGATFYYIFPRASITWSVSTEMLMYAFYPLLWYWLVRVRSFSLKMTGILTIFSILVLSSAFRCLHTNEAFFDRIGVSIFGDISSVSRSPEFSFSFWVWYVSPYSRLLQFICGIVVADYCLKQFDRVLNRSETIFVKIGSLLSFLYVLETFLPQKYAFPLFDEIFQLFGYAPIVCFCIYYCYVCPVGHFSRLLSTSWCVRLGERSYSIYIWHIYFYGFVLMLPGTRFLHVVMAWVGIYIFSAISYEWLEKPLRQRMRKLLSWA